MRPFIHINCAMSADGKIAGIERKQIRISSDEDKDRVKGLRRKYDAILVGVGTVISDDPHLTVKGLSKEENQVRIVLDPNGRTPAGAQVTDDRARTVIITSDDCARSWDGCETIRSPGSGIDLGFAMDRLYSMGIGSILVEGGGTTIASFLKERMFDVLTIYVGSMVIGGSGAPTPADGPGWIAEGGMRLTLRDTVRCGDGVVLEYVPR